MTNCHIDVDTNDFDNGILKRYLNIINKSMAIFKFICRYMKYYVSFLRMFVFRYHSR